MQIDQNDQNNLTGQMLKGYELRELLGRGGFGAVYKAYQPALFRDVAIKVILPEYANHPNFIRRFETEAQTIAKLEHISIVPLYDYWREPNTACLVMRWLKGGSLQDSIDQQGFWQLNDAARLLDQIASALNVAHRNGIIHRDLKPANILLDEERNAYLADFGIAKNLIEAPSYSPEDDRYGSPAYISPEQVMGHPVSAQTDIYSLGVVLYMLLTGRTPFLDPSTTTVIRRQLSESLPPIQMARPELPHAINIIIWRATNKRPEHRYPDAMSLAADFRQLITPGLTPSEMTSKLSTPTPRNIAAGPGGKTLIVDVPVQPENPYKGLKAFQESDAGDFFGRTALIDRLIDRLVETEGRFRFLAVVGPSGSGKSSVVRAGLIPEVRSGILQGSQDWFMVQMTPGASPITELANALTRIAVQSANDIERELRLSEEGLLRAVTAVLPVEDTELLLLIDQFEEVFTLAQDEVERTHFLNLILKAVSAADSRVRIVVTLRADMYDRPLLYPTFGELMRERTEIVLPLSTVEMEQAIVGPVDRMGIRYEQGLVAEIISDVNQQPGALPLLQYALTELFEQREGIIITSKAYENSGGVLGAMARRADELFLSLTPEQQEIARQIFLRLVQIGDGSEDTRRRAQRAELNQINDDKSLIGDVIDQFSQHRLITLDYERATRAPTVEVAHEALIQRWERLRAWLDTSRDELRLYRRLSATTTEWKNSGREPSFLASGARLVQFEVLETSKTLTLTDDEKAYLKASIAARQRAATRLRWFVAGLIVFSLFALALAMFAFDRQAAAQAEQARADEQARISRSRELAVTALTGVSQTDLGLLLSLEALNAANTYEARNSLLTNLQARPHLLTFLNANAGAMRAAAYSGDGALLAAGGEDGSIILWDTRTHQPTGITLAGHSGRINSLAFSPDKHILASGSEDGTIRLWDADSGEAIGQALSGHSESVWSVAFSPDGARLASGSEDNTVRLWDTATGAPIGEPLEGHEDFVFSVAFSPDEARLASGSADGTVRLWDAATGEPLGAALLGHTDWVLTVAFDPDGTRLASSGADETIIFWDAQSGALLGQEDSRHTNWVRRIQFSPDGRFFLSASQDRSVRLWDLRAGDLSSTALAGHQDDVWDAVFSPDSSRIASASDDGSIIVWNTQSDQPLGRLIGTQGDAVLSAAASSDGRWFATAGGNPFGPGSDFAVRLWDAATDQARIFEGHTSNVTALAFSPDSTLLASASSDGSIVLWNTEGGEPHQILAMTRASSSLAVAFSTDGNLLASAGDDGQITFWNVASGAVVGDPLSGHSDGIQSLSFSADGRWLASGSLDNTVRLWDLRAQPISSEAIMTFNDGVTSVVFTSNSQLLAAGSRDGRILLWDTSTAALIGQPLSAHRDWVTALSFQPDGNILASGSADDTIILWDVDTRERLGRPFTGHGDWVTTLAFSSDSRSLISGGTDNQIYRWNVGLESWREQACSVANRNLTADERARYLGSENERITCANLP
jgi:WD40 repeat protein/serine/threonine protein kinase